MEAGQVDRYAGFQEPGLYDDCHWIWAGRLWTLYAVCKCAIELYEQLETDEALQIIDVYGRVHYTLQDSGEWLLFVNYECCLHVRSYPSGIHR